MRRGSEKEGREKRGDLMTEQSRKIHREEIITATAKMCVFHGWRVVMYAGHMLQSHYILSMTYANCCPKRRSKTKARHK